MQQGTILSVSKSDAHTFHKYNCDNIVLLKGLGVEGDAHMGETVKHRSRVAKDPTQPNLRQVHLIQAELLEELEGKGFEVAPGKMGENITTSGIDLLGLPRNTVLHIGPDARVQITGLRNPCLQIDAFQKGLLKAVLDKDEAGNLIRKAGIMGIVLEGGTVTVGNQIRVVFPPKPYLPLERV